MFREGLRPPDPFRAPEPFDAARTQDGMSLNALSDLGPVLVVCLPGLKTSACKKMLKELVNRRPGIEGGGTRILLVHMGDDADAHRVLEPHDLQYLARIADPERAVYAALGLSEERRLLGGVRQLPGAAIVVGGEVGKTAEGRDALPTVL